MNIDIIVQRELDMADGVRPWTKAYAEERVFRRFGAFARCVDRKCKNGKGYRRIICDGKIQLGPGGRTWEEAFKKAL